MEVLGSLWLTAMQKHGHGHAVGMCACWRALLCRRGCSYLPRLGQWEEARGGG